MAKKLGTTEIEVSLTKGGTTYSGTGTFAGGVVTVTYLGRRKSTQLGGLAFRELARMMLRELVDRTRDAKHRLGDLTGAIWMPDDFRKMAAAARAANEQLLNEQSQRVAQERKARSDFVDAAVAALEQHVIPVLDQAVKAFADEGVHAKVARLFDVKSHMASVLPKVRFGCYGPTRPGDGYRLETRPVFFESDGSIVKAGLSEHGFDREAKLPIGSAPAESSRELIVQSVEKALAAYHDDLNSHDKYWEG